MAERVLTLVDAFAAEAAAELRLVVLEGMRKQLERDEHDAREALQVAKRDVMAARALDAIGSIPIGTRVQHRAFPEATGTVVDGVKGIAVLQDKSGEVSDGYEAGEWIPIVEDAAPALQALYRGRRVAERGTDRRGTVVSHQAAADGVWVAFDGQPAELIPATRLTLTEGSI